MASGRIRAAAARSVRATAALLPGAEKAKTAFEVLAVVLPRISGMKALKVQALNATVAEAR